MNAKRNQRAIFSTRPNKSRLAVTPKPAMVEPLEGRVLLTATPIFVSSFPGIGEYTTAGATVNTKLMSGLSNYNGFGVSGSDVFVPETTTIAEYTTAGVLVNASFISGLTGATFVEASGSDLFIINGTTIGEYTTSGKTLNANLITGLSSPEGIAISGSDLFVTQFIDGVAEYTTSGVKVNSNLISGLSGVYGIAASGFDLYIVHGSDVGSYTTAGGTLNASLISTVSFPYGVAVSGSDLFVTDLSTGSVGEYTTAGTVVNAKLISGLTQPFTISLEPAVVSIAVTPPAAQTATAGASKSFTLGSFTQANATGPFSVDVNWGDGSADTKFSLSAAGAITAQSHTYASTADDTASVTITDADGNVSNKATFGVTVSPSAGTKDTTPPKAVASYGKLVTDTSPLTYYKFSITFSDSGSGVLLSSISGRPIYVTGPNYGLAPNTIYARPTSLSPDTNGSPIVGGYRIYPPTTDWTTANNGVYTIWLRKNRVEDLDGNFTPGESLGTFTVNITAAKPAAIRDTTTPSTASTFALQPITPAKDEASAWLDDSNTVLA